MFNVYEAHKYSRHNKAILINDTLCGCFFCLYIFSSQEIFEWEDSGTTAVCPYCGTDSVISECSNYSITKDFLQLMRKYWFKA